MPITATGTTIYVTYVTGDVRGNSATNPWLISDIMAASVASSWTPAIVQYGNIYTIPTYNIYAASAHLQIKNCILNFTGINPAGYAISGTNIVIGNKTTGGLYNGDSAIITSGASGHRYMVVGKMYKTNVYGLAANGALNISCQNLDNEYCTIVGASSQNFYNWVNILDNITVSQCYYGFYPAYNTGTISNMYCYDNYIGVLFYNKTGYTLRNFKARRNTYDILQRMYSNTSGENTIIGADITNYGNIFNGTNTQYTYSKLNFGEEFSVTVDDVNNIPISGASVNIYGSDGILSYSGLTNSSGVCSSDIIRLIDNLEAVAPTFAAVRTITNKNPFTVIIEYEGKIKYSSVIEVLKKTDLQITLLSEVPPIYYDKSVTATASTVNLSGNINTPQPVGIITDTTVTGIVTTIIENE